MSQHHYRGRVYRYYGCASYARNGHAVCTNRVTARVEDAERALLAGIQAEVSRPETVEYIVGRLSAALQAATDARPRRLEALLRQREVVSQKIGRLVLLIEGGTTSTALLRALRAREAELATVEAELAAADASIDTGRLAVLPSVVRQRAADVVALFRERPDRVKAELSRLGVRFTLRPVYDVPEGHRPYLRAEGEGNFELLVGTGSPFPATGSSRPRPTR